MVWDFRVCKGPGTVAVITSSVNTEVYVQILDKSI